MRDTRIFQPQGIETFAQVFLVVGMQFARQVQADFVNITRQVAPAGHRFPGTAGINQIAHDRIIPQPA